jgi:hypothetical protein
VSMPAFAYGLLSVVVVAPGIAAFVCVTSALVAPLSGWATLARKYPGHPRPNGRRGWCSIYLRWFNCYRGGIRYIDDGTLLHLSTWLLFHKPISLPWERVSIVPGVWWSDAWCTVTIGRVRWLMPRHVFADELRRRSGQRPQALLRSNEGLPQAS